MSCNINKFHSLSTQITVATPNVTAPVPQQATISALALTHLPSTEISMPQRPLPHCTSLAAHNIPVHTSSSLKDPTAEAKSSDTPHTLECLAQILPTLPTCLLPIIYDYLELSDRIIDEIKHKYKLELNIQISNDIRNEIVRKEGYGLLKQICESQLDPKPTNTADYPACIKKLIATEPERGYRVLAGLIAAQTIDLSTVELPAQHIVGLAPHLKLLSLVTFDTSLKQIENAILHNQRIMKILHFADIHNIRSSGNDLHLLRNACDNTKVKCYFHRPDIEFGEELSRVIIPIENFSYFNVASMLGKSSVILYNGHTTYTKNYRDSMQQVNTFAISQMLTVDSVLDFSYQFIFDEKSTFNTTLLIDVLKHLVHTQIDIAKRVFVNTYRNIDQTIGSRIKQGLLDSFHAYYSQIFDQPDMDRVKADFAQLLKDTPLCSTFIQHKRVDRPQEVVSKFYTDTLSEAKKSVVSFPE